MKHPPIQYPDEVARELLERYIRGEGEVIENSWG